MVHLRLKSDTTYKKDRAQEMSCPYHYAMNVSVVRAPAYPQIQFIITLIIISFSSGFDSAIIIVSATSV